MSTPEERRKILEMVADGRLSAAAGAELLSAGESAATAERTAAAATEASVEKAPAAAEEPAAPREPEAPLAPAAPQALKGASDARWLNVRVEDMKSGRRRVAVKVPLGLLRFGLRIGSAFTPELERFDWETLSTELADGGGMLVDVQDDDDGERVQIFVE